METAGTVREGRKDRHMDTETNSKVENGWNCTLMRKPLHPGCSVCFLSRMTGRQYCFIQLNKEVGSLYADKQGGSVCGPQLDQR